MSVESPCIKVCRLQNGVCIGCYRTQDEIREWYYASDKIKLEIIKKAENRKK